MSKAYDTAVSTSIYQDIYWKQTRFILRSNKQDYQDGDLLVIKEWCDESQDYTGREFFSKCHPCPEKHRRPPAWIRNSLNQIEAIAMPLTHLDQSLVAEVLAKYSEPAPIAPQPTTLWRKLGLLTGYNYRDISGFAKEEGYKKRLDHLMPLQKVWLRNTVLCNWAVQSGYFSSWTEADRELGRFWSLVEERCLIDGWVVHCKQMSRGKRCRYQNHELIALEELLTK